MRPRRGAHPPSITLPKESGYFWNGEMRPFSSTHASQVRPMSSQALAEARVNLSKGGLVWSVTGSAFGFRRGLGPS